MNMPEFNDHSQWATLQSRDVLMTQLLVTQKHWPEDQLWELRKQIEIELLKLKRPYQSLEKYFSEIKADKCEKKNIKSDLVESYTLFDSNESAFCDFVAPDFSLISVQLQPAFWQTNFWKTAGSQKLHQMILHKPANCQVFRSGFLSSEAEILESALLGFDGIVWHIANKDHFQIQYGIEIGRDLKMNVIPVAKNDHELDLLLQTDAPYIGIWALENDEQKFNMPWLQKMSVKIPSNCLKFVVAANSVHKLAEAHNAAISQWGYRGILF